jgi:hypothetical protein
MQCRRIRNFPCRTIGHRRRPAFHLRRRATPPDGGGYT